jgi:hypothetical protein
MPQVRDEFDLLYKQSPREHATDLNKISGWLASPGEKNPQDLYLLTRRARQLQLILTEEGAPL